MRHWLRRLFKTTRSAERGRLSCRLQVEMLEDRRVPAAPVLDPIGVSLNVPVAKSLLVPISGTDPAGGAVTYTVTSSNPNVTVTQPHTGNTFLQLTVGGFGAMEFELFNDLTPRTVALISGMVKSEFYNGLTFHRVVQNFAIQGGDPAGNGTGGPGFQFDDEFNPNAIFSGNGQLALANSGKDTNGSQFFITDGPQRFLDFNHTIFGQLVRGFDVLKQIEHVPVTRQNPADPQSELSKPIFPVVITSAQIVQDTTDAVFLLQSTGSTPDTTTLTVTATSSTGGTTTETLQAQIVADTSAPSTPVNDPPILGPVTDQVSTTSTPITFHLTRSDLENDAADFKAVLVNAGDSSKVSIQVTPNANNTAADVTVTPLGGFTGGVNITVGVKEKGATSRGSISPSAGNPNPDVFDDQTITVAFGDQPLTNSTGSSVQATEGVAAPGAILATFTDGDTTAVPGDFSVSINWGDGTPLDSTSGQVAGSNGQFTVTGNHTYKEAGVFPIHVVVKDVHHPASGNDNGGATVTVDTTAAVADASIPATAVGPISGTNGTPLVNVPVATFTDIDPNGKLSDYSATIDWGDGSTSPGTIQRLSNGTFQVVGNHTYTVDGSRTLSVTVIDKNTAGDAAPATSRVSTTVTLANRREQFIRTAFHDLTGQDIPRARLDAFLEQMDHGASRAKIVKEIQKLPAHQIFQIQQTYQAVLHRHATAREVRAARLLLASHHTIERLRLDLLGSHPYFLLRGGGTISGYLSALAQDIFHHPLDFLRLSEFTSQLNSGTVALIQVAAQMLQQVDAKQAEVQSLYLEFLHRGVTVAEQNAQVRRLQNGVPLDTIIRELVSSPEYLNKRF